MPENETNRHKAKAESLGGHLFSGLGGCFTVVWLGLCALPEDSSDDSPESPFAGWPSSSSEAGVSLPYLENAFQPSEKVELYRNVSFVPLSVVLLALAQLLQVFVGPSSLAAVAVLSVLASAAALIGVTRWRQALPEEDSEAGDEES